MSRHKNLSAAERKQRVLTKSRSSVTTAVSDALVGKSDRLFFLCRSDGSVPDEDGHGFGLYFNDTRFVRAYDFRFCGETLDVLSSNDEGGDHVYHFLTNPDLEDAAGHEVSKESLGVAVRRSLDGTRLTLNDEITFENYSLEDIEASFAVEIQPDFASVFDVRGMLGEKPGTLHAPKVGDHGLEFVYDGADSIRRTVQVTFQPAPDEIDEHTAVLRWTLEARTTGNVTIRIDLDEERDDSGRPDRRPARRDSTADDTETYLHNRTDVHVPAGFARTALNGSFRDLRMLQTQVDGETFFAAGVPWFVTIFGRDSILTALQMLAYNPQIGQQTLALMAKYQGRQEHEWTEEQPGKIPHELRHDELTNTGQVPYTPYYGTVDATPLFLLLMARHARWTGSLRVFAELRDNVEAALDWVDDFGDSDGDGYLDYATKTKSGLINEAWKDSSDAMVTESGAIAEAPVAPCEVQGYVYAAKVELADVFERAGDADTAARLRREGEELKQRFNRDYWLDDLGVFAMALAKDQRPLRVVSSNSGQVLWSGIADDDLGRTAAARLMEDDMFSGWGVRTLSTGARRYNPISYHLGSVWPHDNSIIFGGLRRYAHDEGIAILEALLEASQHFSNARLPELFGGFSRDEFPRPVHYPVACHPQAWAAGSIPFMLTEALGLRPDGFANRLLVERPLLPAALSRVELRHLRVGSGECHLCFERQDDGKARLTVISASEGVEVSVHES